MSRGYLLVQVEGASYGLPLEPVLQVDDIGEVLEVPTVLPAMRGLTPLNGRLVPLIHLGALLGNREPPTRRGAATVLVGLGGRDPSRGPRGRRCRRGRARGGAARASRRNLALGVRGGAT